MLLRRPLLCCLAAAFALPGVALSAEADKLSYEGQQFDLRVRVAGTELALNGTGVRQVAWFKGYLAALYLPARAATAAQAVGQAGPKRIQLRMLHDVPAVEFSKAVRKGVSRNLPAGDAVGLNDRLERFVKAIEALGKVRAKDVVNLDFEPGRGLAMYVNATVRGEPIPGDDFYAALLRSFIGDVPYDVKMRAGLLGKPS